MTLRSLLRTPLPVALTCVVALLALGACGTGSTATTGTPTGRQSAVPVESNPPGDIPDNLAYVLYRDQSGGFQFTHPEGWTQTSIPGGVAFTDKLNSVKVTSTATTTAPTVASARQDTITQLQHTQPAFELRSVTAVSEPAGQGVLIVYRRNSAPDPVTGRQYRDEVQRYELQVGSHVVVMELSGAVGSDNVDPYRTMVTSLRAA